MFKLRNLNIRFDGPEGGAEVGGGEQVVEQQLVTSPPQQESTAQQGQGNPAWAPIREALDPITFNKIEPHLKEWEKQAQARVTSANQQFEAYKPILGDRQPDFVQKAITYAEQLDADPAAVYQMLGAYLQQTGHLPNAQEAQQALEENEEQEVVQDPRVDQIQQGLQQLRQEQLQAQASTRLEADIGKLREAHKELVDEDVTEIIRRAAFVAQQNAGRSGAKIPTLEEAYGDYVALRNRILSTPRAADSAPQLVPPSGGNPAGQQQGSWGSKSRTEVQDAVAALLSAGKGQ